MSTFPNARRDYAGSPKGKAGKARIDLPTQSLSDQAIVEDVPFQLGQPGFELRPFLTPHPKAPAYLLVNQFPFQGNDQTIYVRQIYKKPSGVPLAGNTVGGEFRFQFAKDGVTTTTTQRRPYGDDPVDGPNVVSGSSQPTDAVESQSTTITADSFVPLTGYDYGADQWRRFAKDGAVTVTRTLVDKGAEADSGPLVISSRVEAMSDAEENSAIKTTVTASELVPLTSYNFADPAAKGGTTKTTETPVSSTVTSGPTGFGILDSRVTALNAKQSVQTVTQVEDGFPVLIEYDRDPETRSLITITHQIVNAKTVVPLATLPPGTIEAFKPIDDDHSIRVTTVYAMPDPYEMQVHASENMPTLLEGYEWDSDCGRFIEARHGYATLADATLEISFSTEQERTTIPQLKTRTFAYGGFTISNVINDAKTLVFTGKCVGSMPVPASNPSLADYIADWQGKYIVRSAESKPWRGSGIWRTEKLKVKME